MCAFQRPKQRTQQNSTPQNSSRTFSPKVIHSVQRQGNQAKYNQEQEHNQTNKGWSLLNPSMRYAPTPVEHRVSGKVSQQKSVAQLQQVLQPKRWETGKRQLKGSNNVMQLKAAARMPLDSLQGMRVDDVVQRNNEPTSIQDNDVEVIHTGDNNLTPSTNEEEHVPSALGVGTDISGWLAPPEIQCPFPDNPPEYEQQGNELVANLKNAIERSGNPEYYKISFGNDTMTIICHEQFSSAMEETLHSANMISHWNVDDEGQVPTSNGRYYVDEDYVTITAPVNLNRFQLDPVSKGQLQVFGDFNGTPNPPRAEEMHDELLYHVSQLLRKESYSGVSAEIHKTTKKTKLVFKGEESVVKNAIDSLHVNVVGNMDVTYRDIFKTGKRFFKSKKQGRGLFSGFSRSQNNQENKQSIYTVSMPFLRPTDWPDIMGQSKNVALTLGYADATDIAQEQAFNNDNAYTILDRFKMIGQVMKGEGENVPEDVSELIGNSSSLWAWSVPGLNLLVILNKFLNIGTYSKRRKNLRKALTKTQEQLNEDNIDNRKQSRLMKLQEGIKYGIHKMKKLIVTLWVDAIASIVQLISRIFTLIFPQIAVGTIFVDVAAMATKLGSLLFRKGKGLYKHIKGTRGKKRYASAESIFNSALVGDEAGLMAIRALNLKTLMGKIGGKLWTGTKKTGKGIGTTVATPFSSLFGKGKIKPNVKLNKRGLDNGLSDKSQKQMQWGKWPSDAYDFKKMLQNVNSSPNAKLVFIKGLAHELKSSL